MQWRSGNGKDLRRGDTELVKRLLPSILTPSRRRVLKAFLLEEKRLLEEHLKALEGCKLAEDLLASSTPIPHIPYSPSTVPTMTGEQVRNKRLLLMI